MHTHIGSAAALLFVVAAVVGGVPKAAAMPADASLKAPSLVEEAACRVVRSRVVRPDGRVIFRTKRECGPAWRAFGSARDCDFVRKRIVRPNGTVVHQRIRRCR
jgi:hypothetical protein